jgi:hypothetical protein
MKVKADQKVCRFKHIHYYSYTSFLDVSEIWYLVLKEQKFKVNENEMSKENTGPKRYDITGKWKKNYIMWNFIITVHLVLLFGQWFHLWTI